MNIQDQNLCRSYNIRARYGSNWSVLPHNFDTILLDDVLYGPGKQRTELPVFNQMCRENLKRDVFLPEDMIKEILIRLQVKPLLRFKCVCKSWYSLISSSIFIKTHLIRNTNNYANPKMILKQGYSYKHFTCSVSSILSDYNIPYSFIQEIDIPTIKDHRLRFVGSCNGLLCLAVPDNTVIICNPTLKMFNKLPSSVAHLKPYRRTHPTIQYGFGYDESNDDYKIVQIYDFSKFDNEGYIYSLRDNSWRKIKKNPEVPIHFQNAYGVFACGKLHWAYTSSLYFLTVDLVTEEHGKVARPKAYGNYEDEENVRWYILQSQSRGRLCACAEYQRFRLDIWVMKEYGVEETWTNLGSIIYQNNYLDGRWWPVFVMDNGEVLLHGSSLYDPKYNTIRSLTTYTPNGRTIYTPNGYQLRTMGVTYIESLVLPYFDPLVYYNQRM